MKTIFKIILSFLSVIVIALIVIILFVDRKRMKIPKNESTEIYAARTSTMNFPLMIAMDDIENLANTKIKTVIDKKIPTKNGNDTVILRIRRLGDIKFELRNNYIYSSVPLQLEVRYSKKITGKKGIEFFSKEPHMILITPKFKSDINIRENMKLKTRTILTELQWDKEPDMKILGIKINLKEKINELMIEKSPEVTSKIDELIAAKVNIKKPTLKIWNKLQKAIKANKKQKDLFVKIQPQTLSVHLDKSLNDSLKLDLIVTSKIFLRFEQDTSKIVRTPFPKKITIISKDKVDTISSIYLNCLFPLTKLNQIAQDKLKGKELNVKGFKIKIRKVEIINGNRDIYVRLKYSGSRKGWVVAKGFPQLSANKKTISVKHISFENKVEDKLLNPMIYLLHEQILNMLRNYSSFNVEQLMESLPVYARKAFEKSKVAKKADMVLNNLEVDNLKIKLTRDNIQFIISGHSSFGLALRKENF